MRTDFKLPVKLVGGGGQEVAPATSTTAGIVKPDNVTISVAQDGTINCNTASASQAGVVKVGSGLAIDANGVLSLDLADGDEVSY